MASDEKLFLGKNIYTRLEDVLNPANSNMKVTEDFSILIKPSKETAKSPMQKKQRGFVNPLHEKYLVKFKQAIKENSHSIPNYKECLNEIDKEFKMNSGSSLTNTQMQSTSQGNALIDDKSFTRLVKEKVEANKKRYGMINEFKEKEERDNVTSDKEKVLMNKETIKHANKRVPNKRFIILKNCLNSLKSNGITIEALMKKNPFQKRAYELHNSIEFFEAVKLDRVEQVERMLHSKPEYLYSYDFLNQTPFHWAAKRGLKRMLQTLLSYGRCCNQYDLNHRTPLMLAAMNNYYDCCQVLVNNGAIANLKDKEGKEAVDLTTDKTLKIMLISSVDDNPFIQLFKGKKHSSNAI